MYRHIFQWTPFLVHPFFYIIQAIQISGIRMFITFILFLRVEKHPTFNKLITIPFFNEL